MRNKILNYVFISSSLLLSRFSLATIHRFGAVFGVFFHWLKPKTKVLLIQNLKQSALFKDDESLKNAIQLNIHETGKTMLESLVIWGSSQHRVLSWIKAIHHIEIITEAVDKKKGIIFITPHIGAYEVASIYYASQRPITILYRPARKLWMNTLITSGRSKGQIKLAPTTLAGVKKLFVALKNGEAVGILPDQIASKGEGEWANFFGKPMYTMVLASKLAKKTGAVVVMVVAERLAEGKGFVLHLESLAQDSIGNVNLLNQQVELQIKKFPLQYMWNYNRYKQP